MNCCVKPASRYQREEISIISLPNTVVQPFAMMVKLIDASIALSTVLCLQMHMCVTDRTK